MIRRLVIVIFGAGMLWLPASVIAQENDSRVSVHVVQRGENMFRIALQYGLTVDELASYNGIADPTNIQVGQNLLIPLEAVTSTSESETHLVQAGETLRSIAEIYGLTVEQLATQNNIVDVNTLYVGQVLVISANTVPLATPTISPPVIPAQPILTGTNMVYTVQAGETLFRIATRFGLSVNDLTRVNNIADPTLIYAGQQIIVPGIEPPQLAPDLPTIISSLEMSPLFLVEGQTGHFHLSTTAPVNLSGSFLNRSITGAAEQDNTQHDILVGVPIFTEAGVYPLSLILVDGGGQQTVLNLNIQVLSGNYGSEYITLLSDRADLLDPNVEAAEQNLLQSVISNFTSTRYFDGPMGLPAAASVTSPFGRKRSYNGGPFDHFHSGADFAGAPGTPVLAAASGVVVLADTLNVRGRSTIIDHGWGVFTGYWHQTEQYVQVGEIVTVGQIIGTIGATGRVTGPHLHWELWVNGVPVDPMQWVQMSFS
ncbi:MAG: LysM peptidoglycan-binding domain-containing protein [Anaerolineae bacterium]|nr:LysM peptidoglycan-binding domain-containing protein [Anaerolineae bacterium]